MDGRKDTAVEALLEHLIEHGPSDIATVFGRAFELAMQIERERFLRAGPYERTAERQGYANGYKPKRIDTPAGTVTVDVPKTAGHDGEPFYPQSLERGRRSVRAVMLAVAETRRSRGSWPGKTRTLTVRRLSSCWTARSIGFEVRMRRRWCSGSAKTARPSGTLSSSHAASFGAAPR